MNHKNIARIIEYLFLVPNVYIYIYSFYSKKFIKHIKFFNKKLNSKILAIFLDIHYQNIYYALELFIKDCNNYLPNINNH